MSEKKEYIERGALIKFIEDGLNEKDPQKNFGNDGVRILTEVQFIPAADVVEVTRDASKAITHLDSCRVLVNKWSKQFDEICNILYDAFGNEIITIDRLRELAKADAEGRVVIRPDCGKCKHCLRHYSLDPCCDCMGQTGIGEKGYYFEPSEAERALAATEPKGDATT